MIRRLLLGVLFPLAAATAWGAPEATEAVLERVADWQLAHPAAKWKPTEWHNAAFYTGVMALDEVAGSRRFRIAMAKMGAGNDWKLGPRRYHADDTAVGQTYADLYLLDREPRMIAAMRARFDFILAHPNGDNLLADKATNPDYLDRWSWCDALFMAPPAWAKLSQATGDPRYLDYAVTRWSVTSDFLYDPAEHLYYRDSHAFALREKNGARVFWARGNGWVMAGLARMLQAMPPDHPGRPRFAAQFREMADRIADLQGQDGFWRASLLDPATYPMQESSGTGFFCYALAWGLNERILDRDRYLPVVRHAWDALLACVEPDGKVDHVQPVGFTPVTFDPASTEPYGVGAFLLAGRQMIRLDATE
jgi:unsaturated rhamnogalacturonyl hydrolase